MSRFFHPGPLHPGARFSLTAGAARHVQVLRLQPGQTITLFDGQGGQWQAVITRIGRSEVEVALQHHTALEREAPRAVHLAVGMPANERMDWLVEKAVELGAASLQPLHTAHSVLRLSGERAARKQAHWQSIAVAACEQCGRNRLPVIAPVAALADWLTRVTTGLSAPPAPGACQALRCVLSLQPGSQPLGTLLAGHASQAPVWLLSGPEGGFCAAEDAAARAAGWLPVTLGVRVLRTETAVLAALTLASASR